MTAIGCMEVASDAAADRSFVIGPPGRWLLLGDSADALDYERLQLPAKVGDDLSATLSELAPLVEVLGSDSHTYRLRLFENGALRDTFQNGEFPFDPFESAAAAAPLAGSPDRWRHLLLPGRTVDELRGVFAQSIRGIEWPSRRHGLQWSMCQLLGLPERLVEVGYTWNPEGVDVSYRQYVQHMRKNAASGPLPDLDAFTELHFARAGSAGRGDWERPFWPAE